MATIKNKTIDKATSDKISFMAYMVLAFAEAYKMKEQEAFLYLKKYGGWEYLTKNWWALHTDNSFWALSDIFDVCRNNGGLR